MWIFESRHIWTHVIYGLTGLLVDSNIPSTTVSSVYLRTLGQIVFKHNCTVYCSYDELIEPNNSCETGIQAFNEGDIHNQHSASDLNQKTDIHTCIWYTYSRLKVLLPVCRNATSNCFINEIWQPERTQWYKGKA